VKPGRGTNGGEGYTERGEKSHKSSGKGTRRLQRKRGATREETEAPLLKQEPFPNSLENLLR